MPTLSKLLRQAAELQRRTWKSYEPIWDWLGYSEIPPEHVVSAVVRGVEQAALALGDDQERIKLFRARQGIEEKRKMLVPEENECWACGEPLGAPDENGIRVRNVSRGSIGPASRCGDETARDFRRPPRSRNFWIDYRDANGRRHRERIGTRAEALGC